MTEKSKYIYRKVKASLEVSEAIYFKRSMQKSDKNSIGNEFNYDIFSPSEACKEKNVCFHYETTSCELNR